MPTLTKPVSSANGYAFEKWCLIFFQHFFGAKDANFYGSNSAGQDGIDIRLSHEVSTGQRELVVIQCKDYSKLTFSDYKKDLGRAVRKFERELRVKPSLRLYFIVATTANRVDNSVLDEAANTYIDDMGAEYRILRREGRLQHEVFPWQWFEAKVESRENVQLQQIFYPLSLPGDSQRSEALNRFDEILESSLSRGKLATARTALDNYKRQAKLESDKDFSWVPARMADRLLQLFLEAGDFAAVTQLLDLLLAERPYHAGYQVAHLRALRVLNKASRHVDREKGRSLFQKSSEHPGLLEELARFGIRIGSVHGSDDEVLTLLLWIISYTDDAALAQTALRRAHGVAMLSLPPVARANNGSEGWRVAPDGALMVQGEENDNWWNAGLLAGAVVSAYCYIQRIHVIRFGLSATHVAEADDRELLWPWLIGGIDQFVLPSYAGFCEGSTMESFERHLPNFAREWRGRDPEWPYGEDNSLGIERPHDNGVVQVCSARFLLRDVREKQLVRRMKDLLRRRPLDTGPRLWITQLAVERMAMQLWWLAQLSAGSGSVQERDAHSARHSQLNNWFDLVERDEGYRDLRGPIIASKAYFDLEQVHGDHEMAAALALCGTKGFLFAASSHEEQDTAMRQLSLAKVRPSYWMPSL